MRVPHSPITLIFFSFFFNDTATTEIYTLSLHDALPILECACAHDHAVQGYRRAVRRRGGLARTAVAGRPVPGRGGDRKSTRLNSSHLVISYAVFCLKKKKLNCQIGVIGLLFEHLKGKKK